MAVRHFYAALSPRGFQNETEVHKFAARKERDEWIAEKDSPRAFAIKAKGARYYLGNRGDAATQNWNCMVDHTVESDATADWCGTPDCAESMCPYPHG